MTVWMGTSGWNYAHWRGGLYPRSVKTADWLGHYAARFATVELNNSFYRLPERSTFEQWAAAVPDDFVFAVKASRYLTHIKRLKQSGEPVHRLMERATGLGSKLGPLLVQLPPNLKIDIPSLDETLGHFPKGVRVAVEFRHESWYVPEVEQLLRSHGAALCHTDVDGPRQPHWQTADWGYVRFHHGRARPESCYGPSALNTWADRLAGTWTVDADLFVYFNNDLHSCAPRNARQMATALEHRGMTVTRVPAVRSVPFT